MSSNLNFESDNITPVNNFFHETKEDYYKDDIIRCQKKNIKICNEQCGKECTTYCDKEDLHSYFELQCGQIDELEEKLGRKILDLELKYLTTLLHQYIDELDANIKNSTIKLIPSDTLPNIVDNSKSNVVDSDQHKTVNNTDSKVKKIIKPILNLSNNTEPQITNNIESQITNNTKSQITNNTEHKVINEIPKLKSIKKYVPPIADPEIAKYNQNIDKLIVEQNQIVSSQTKTYEEKLNDYSNTIQAMILPDSSLYFPEIINPIIFQTTRYSVAHGTWLSLVKDSWISITEKSMYKKISEIMITEINNVYGSVYNQDKLLIERLEFRRKKQLKMFEDALITVVKKSFIEKYIQDNMQYLLMLDTNSSKPKSNLDFTDNMNGKIEKIGNYKIGDSYINYDDSKLYLELLLEISNEKSMVFIQTMNTIIKKEIYLYDNYYLMREKNYWIYADEVKIKETIRLIIKDELKRFWNSLDVLSNNVITEKQKLYFHKQFLKCTKKCSEQIFIDKYYLFNIKHFTHEKPDFNDDTIYKNFLSKNIKFTGNVTHIEPRIKCFERFVDIYPVLQQEAVKVKDKFFKVVTPIIKEHTNTKRLYDYVGIQFSNKL